MQGSVLFVLNFEAMHTCAAAAALSGAHLNKDAKLLLLGKSAAQVPRPDHRLGSRLDYQLPQQQPCTPAIDQISAAWEVCKTMAQILRLPAMY